MPTDETITLDPSEFSTGRVELGLDKLGIKVREASWGDADIETFLVRQALGEVPADRHPPNRTIELKLRVGKTSAKSLAEVAQNLQKKVGLIQREGGWVRRDLDSGSGFSANVAAKIHQATLSGLDGWLMARRQTAPEVALTMVAAPYLYGVKEVESEVFKVANGYFLKWEMEKVLGSAPGFVRVTVKNEGATDWKGLISSIESRDHPQDATKTTTADVFYECENLTVKGGSAVAELAGASNGKVVKNEGLTVGYIQVLNSKISASGLHMTHIGSRRFWLRLNDAGGTSENIEVCLEWRALGAARWNQNQGVRVKIANGTYSKLDMGEVRLEPAVLGSQRWEWRILARARNGAGAIRLDCVYIHPTEQFLSVVTPDLSRSPDSQSTKSPVTAENDASSGSLAWTNPANVVSSNNVYATAANATPSSQKLTNHLKITKLGFAIPGTATITGIAVEVERKSDKLTAINYAFDSVAVLVIGGVRQSLSFSRHDSSLYWPLADTYKAYGSANDLWENTPSSITPAVTNAEGFGFSLQVSIVNITETVTISVDHIKMTVYYTEESDPNRMCFATRSVDLRSDGILRQHQTDDVWGRGVPNGFLPYAPPSGLEARAARGLIVPSIGDHDVLSDTGPYSLSAQVKYFPGYLFTSEAP